jgi:tetratricopeptide (TPR) repeat protein
LTSFYYANWHPLTWISLQADATAHGLSALGYHASNIVLHALDSALLFVVLHRYTAAVWRSLLAASLFAFHPLHVESVAWITERKDVLSTFFWLVAMLGYAWYVKRPALQRYLAVCLAFVLGLIAKSMVVTLPLVLLLMDYWPLGRMALTASEGSCGERRPFRYLVFEKLPLLALAAASGAITIAAQMSVPSPDTPPLLLLRLENACMASVIYLAKTIVPVHLAAFYPYPSELFPWWQVGGALLVLAAISGVVFAQRESRPYLLVGWLWYLVTLLPVLGIMQIHGGHAHADRYTYVPLIGIFVAAAWGLGDLVVSGILRQRAAVTFAVLVAIACAAVTWVQEGYWRDSQALWQHAVDVTASNAVANYNLGVALVRADKLGRAKEHFLKAVEIRASYHEAYNNLGLIVQKEGKRALACRYFREAIACNPSFAVAHINLAACLEQTGAGAEALEHYRRATELAPEYAAGYYHLGRSLVRQGRLQEALPEFSHAIALEPDYSAAHHELAVALSRLGRHEEAIGPYRQAIRTDANATSARIELGRIYLYLGRLDDAIESLRPAVECQPESAEAYSGMGMAYMLQRRTDPAVTCFEHSVQAKPSAAACMDLAHALQASSQVEAAREWYQRGLAMDPEWPRSANKTAWGLATDPDPERRHGIFAHYMATQVCEATQFHVAEFLDTLAAADAEIGHFDDAQHHARMALKLLEPTAQDHLASAIQSRLKQYGAHRSYRELPVAAH